MKSIVTFALLLMCPALCLGQSAQENEPQNPIEELFDELKQENRKDDDPNWLGDEPRRESSKPKSGDRAVEERTIDEVPTIENYLKPIGTLTANGALRLPATGDIDRPAKIFPVPGQANIGPRMYGASLVGFQQPGTCHRRLYFEDHRLEAHGYHSGLAQPYVSAVRFLKDTAFYPVRRIRTIPRTQLQYRGTTRFSDATLSRY